MTTIAYLPLDDRPVNTTQVADLARIAGASLLMPPRSLLGTRGAASDLVAVGSWLESVGVSADAVVVSLNQLVHGGYVPSRRTSETMAAWGPRLEVLRRLRSVRPELPIFGFVVLMRTKDRNDAGAEPEYWGEYGTALATFSAQLYGVEHGAELGVEAAGVPGSIVTDWLTRRLRLHQLHLAAIDLAATGVLDLLTINPEDTTVESVSTSEREWLQTWVRRLDVADRVLIYPGADEVGGVLVMRVGTVEQLPSVRVLCARSDRLNAVAAYEDVPVVETIRSQVNAAGMAMTERADADLILAVHPPGDPMGDWARDPVGPSDTGRADFAYQLSKLIAAELSAQRRVSVADVADANGGDPLLVEALAADGALDRLAGYAGWNTAGNTIGSALAQGAAALRSGPGDTRGIVAHRLVEDFAYQSQARAGLTDSKDVGGLTVALSAALGRLPGLGPAFRIEPDSVRLPWGRTFEVDFTVRATDTGGDG